MTGANSLRTKLNALANIANSGSDAGTLGVQVSRETNTPTTNEGYIFSVTFQGSRVMGSVPLLTVESNTLGNQHGDTAFFRRFSATALESPGGNFRDSFHTKFHTSSRYENLAIKSRYEISL